MIQGVWQILLTPSWGDKREKQPKYAQNFKGWLRFLTITSKRSNGFSFSQFRHYLCFRSRGIHCWHFYWSTMFAWSRKSKSTSGSRGTDDSVLWIFEIFTLFMFSRSGNPLLIFLQSYHVWVTSKIQVDFRFKTYSEVTSCHVMSRLVTSCHVMSRNVTSCHVMSRHVTSCNVM